MIKKRCIVLVTCFLLFPFFIAAGAKRLTVVHTNDLHSHLLGFSPNRDYTPETTNDDATIGGWARMASIIKSEKQKRSNPVLILDGGDFLMGSLFHMISREHALELELMYEMGYDAITLGNHEFDLKPVGLARIIEAAAAKKKLPDIVASNLLFDAQNAQDDRLEAVFRNGLIRPFLVIEKQGLKIGFFGLVGKDAAEVAPFASPVKFDDPIATAERMVEKLRNEEQVDLVVCLSHSGLANTAKHSEDENLARETTGIDLIISGHTHTKLATPRIVNGTIIVQSGSYGKHVGVLDLVMENGHVTPTNYDLIAIDDSIATDGRLNAIIQTGIETVNNDVLSKHNLAFDQVLVESDFDLKLENTETGLGNLVTDAIRWAVDRAEYNPSEPASRVRLAVQSNGVIRDDLLKGETGFITVSDLFRTVPLGIGLDDSMSYPLISFYVHAIELKRTMEVLTTIYPLKGTDYFLQFSGAKITYNPNRMLFDRVTEILLEEENGEFASLDVSDSNKTLYKVTSNYYNSTFLKVIGSFTNNILTIVPKDKNGNPIEDLADHRIDADLKKEGVQEVKEWVALMQYVQTFADTDGNGIPNMPVRYKTAEQRQTVAASINPINLLKNGNYLTWLAAAAILLVFLLVVFAIYLIRKLIAKRTV